MTAQIHDRVLWNHQDYLLVGVDGAGLFDPWEHGLETSPTTTANWRGWAARYAIEDDRLILMELTDVGLWVQPGTPPPSLLGVQAVAEGPGSYRFPDMQHPVSFTGRLLIAKGFIQSLYRHMGFHPAWKFEESWEFVVEDGRVAETRELTAEMRTLRKNIQKGKIQDPDSPTRPNWIARTFGLDFRRSKGD